MHTRLYLWEPTDSFPALKLITAVGVKDLIIVSTEDSVMVCPKDRAQDVKHIVEKLKSEEKYTYL